MANDSGPALPFATFSPFKSRRDRLLEWVAMLFAPGNDPGARDPMFLHTGQFCPVSPRQLARAGLSSPKLKHGALLFMSVYNGDPETYFRGFNQQLFDVMNEVWMRCEGWEDAKEFSKLDRFIKKYERLSSTFFSAYPDVAKRVRASLMLRRRLDELLGLARSPASDIAFKQEFDRVAQVYWGNAEE